MNPGTIVSGRYELGERLGLGGMSTVHLAFDRRLERYVAVKLLAEHLADDAQFVARFRREALAAARLVHPNVVQVYDFGLDDATGRHYLVMERIVGPSMADVLRDRGYLPVPEALDVVQQACRGLEYAHRNGVVHRDVKPGNLLLSEADGTVKLADFGIAKAVSEESSITQVGSVLGTAAYLAPEQAAGEEVGPPADLYALGVVTYQLISGRLPYEAASLTELALKQQRETPALLSDVVAGVSVPLARAVDRALALDTRHRWPSAGAMREGLEEAARGIAPATSATSIAAIDETDRTQVVPRGGTEEWDAPATAGPVRARSPRPPRTGAQPTAAPAAAAAPARRAEAAPQRSGRGGARRLTGAILVLLLLAGGIAIAWAATSSGGDAVELRRVVYDDAARIIDELEGLVKDNTQ
ncbi:protein kinase [Conexibacter sp. SYSU D00693]|uniref:protein kinase domain-containing protein n=1 Tax=Conexibacter sp. SYSU D00693 TaxID=2812560 RepID=UPI00196AFDE8|nr:protein kinase [Conexibacter sp. SYSU D00693]